MTHIRLEEVRRLLTTHHLEGSLEAFLTLLSERTELPELGLNAHAFAKLKKRILTTFR